MKVFLAMVGGFVLTLATFAGGIVTAIFFLNAEPVPVRSPGPDAGDVWTSQPVTVEPAAQNFDRLAARPVPESGDDAVPAPAEAGETEAAGAEGLIDTTTTGAIPPDAAGSQAALQPEPAAAASVNAAHVQWCSEQYRSYRPHDNSYTPYSGGKRECISPFSKGASTAAAPAEAESYEEASVDRPYVAYVTEDEEPGGYLSPEHVQSCFDRYRSYRPEDNSYQPYGGGPRRQCR